VVEVREPVDGKNKQKQLEIDFVANNGNKRLIKQKGGQLPPFIFFNRFEF